jgi:5-methylcytosine-specific restriction endonuclease McrA
MQDKRPPFGAASFISRQQPQGKDDNCKDTVMQNKSYFDKTNLSKINHGKANAEYVWKQVEDVVVPRLRLSVIERAIYYHLLRHSRIEQKVRYQFSIAALGRRTNLSLGPIRRAIHRLMAMGAALHPAQQGRARHRSARTRRDPLRPFCRGKNQGGCPPHVQKPQQSPAVPLDEIDFLQTRELRRAIHAREGGRCFYCLRRQAASMKTLDHVVPRSLSGSHSYLNLVSACLDCNSTKGEKRAEDFLRLLHRERRLTVIELRGRVRALKALAAGKLRPVMQRNEVHSTSDAVRRRRVVQL